MRKDAPQYDTVDSCRLERPSYITKLDWSSIKDTCAQLEVLLTDVQGLERTCYYQLGPASSSQLGEHALQDDLSFFEKIMRRIRPRIDLATAQSIHDKANPWLQYRYAVHGNTKLHELTSQVELLVNKLWGALQKEQQDFMVEGMRLLLRDAVARTSDKKDLADLSGLLGPADPSPELRTIAQPISPLAALKTKRLNLNIDISAAELRNQPPQGLEESGPRAKRSRDKKIKEGKLEERTMIGIYRDLAVYRSRVVLIEWKRIAAGLEDKLHHRVEALASLLSQTESGTTGSLKCIGSFKDVGSGRYGFVFSLPACELPSALPGRPPLVLSLRERLLEPTVRLEDRMHIAAQLTWSVRQLHTAGWLHKAVRSDNFLFNQGAGAVAML